MSSGLRQAGQIGPLAGSRVFGPRRIFAGPSRINSEFNAQLHPTIAHRNRKGAAMSEYHHGLVWRRLGFWPTMNTHQQGDGATLTRLTALLLHFGTMERSRRRLLSSASASALGLAAISSSIMLLPARPAVAQTFSIPPGGNIASFVSSPAPPGAVVQLQGDASLSTTQQFTDLTVNGVPGISTITLSSGGFFQGIASPTSTLDLSNVTITGGSRTGNGGAVSGAQSLSIPITGSVTFSGNTVTGPGNGGGAIFTGGGVSIGTSASPLASVTFTGNSAADFFGGAISAPSPSGDVNISGNAITLSGNASGRGGGGAIFAQDGITLTGNTITASSNSAVSFGGALNANNAITISGNRIVLSNNVVTSSTPGDGGGGAIHLGSTDPLLINGNEVIFSGNTAAFGGAISGSGRLTITGNNVEFTGNTAADASGFGFGGAIVGLIPASDVLIDGNAITLSGNTAASSAGGAIAALGGNVSIGNSGSTVNITGNSANFGGAIGVTGSGNVVIDGSTISLSGNTARTSVGGAISASGIVSIGDSGSTVDIIGNTAASEGGAIRNVGTTTINGNVTLSRNMAGTSGGAIFSNGFTLNANGPTTISGNTAGANGGAIFAGSSVVLNALGGDINLTGNQAGGLGGAIYLDPDILTLNATGGNITFANNTQGAGQANAIFINNANPETAVTFNAATGRAITFFDPIANNAANGLISVTKTGPGIVSFDGSLYTTPANQTSLVYANTVVQEGTFEITNNAVYGVRAADVGGTAGPSTFTTNPGTTLQGGVLGTVRVDDFTLGGTLNIAGRAPPGAPFSTFTIDTVSNTFQPGNLIRFNTRLDADNSPSDLLRIGGTTTGTAGIFVTNVGGAGAETTANGILLVEAINGATTTGAFTLANPELRAGAYTYRLFQGSFGGTDPTLANDWFLRSSFLGNGGNGNGGNGNGPPPGILPPDPAPDFGVPPPPGIWPIIGPEIATYGVVQPIARQMGLTTLGTLHERVGDAAADAACLNAASTGALVTKAPPVPESICRPAVWGRLFGQQIDNHYRAFADPRASGQVAGIQTGIDVWRGSLIPGHIDTAGVYFAYGNGNVRVDGLVTNAAATAYILQRTGSLNLNAYSFGGYWTHYGPAGWYLDAVLQGSIYQGDASTQFASLPANGTGFTSSLEAGYPIPLPWFGPRFVLEPEAQIIWQQVSFDDANDGLGPVALGTTSGTTGRLGLRGKWTIDDPAGRVWQPYVVGNLWRDWGAAVNTMFGPDAVLLAERATRLEFAGGLSAKLAPGLTLYAQAGYQFAVDDTDGGRRDGVKGNFGVHYTW